LIAEIKYGEECGVQQTNQYAHIYMIGLVANPGNGFCVISHGIRIVSTALDLQTQWSVLNGVKLGKQVFKSQVKNKFYF